MRHQPPVRSIKEIFEDYEEPETPLLRFDTIKDRFVRRQTSYLQIDSDDCTLVVYGHTGKRVLRKRRTRIFELFTKSPLFELFNAFKGKTVRVTVEEV